MQLQLRTQNKKRAILFTFALSVFCYGCSDSGNVQQAQPAPAPRVQKQNVVTAPTNTAVTVEEKKVVYAYNPVGRRDPFAPIIVKQSAKAKSGDRPPLERFNIGEFKLSGIVWGGFGYNAMVEGPDGKGYFVRVGTIMGPNRGVVKKITQNQMIIEEKIKMYSGETERKEIIVELRKKQEAAP